MIKGVLLAWKLCCKGGRVVGDVVDHSGSIGLEVYRREEGERNNKYRANKCNTIQDMAISCAGCDLAQCYTTPMKGEPIRESFPGSGQLSDR